jgi:putative phosphoribosyl transferase
VIDDGIATGATMRAALRATRARAPETLILAVPVASTEALAELREEADEVVCLEAHDFLGALGLYYSDFRHTSDEAVIDAIARHSSGQKEG